MDITIFYPILISLVVLPVAFLPTIIALKKNHPYKVQIILVNIFGSFFGGAGWVIALIWSFILPESKQSST